MPGLYGRDAELEALSMALDTAARGDRALVLLRGEAGIG
jgi:predicted ATPase